MRIAIRGMLDVLAIGAVFILALAASHSFTLALVAAVATGLYGVWCFFDGATPPHP